MSYTFVLLIIFHPIIYLFIHSFIKKEIHLETATKQMYRYSCIFHQQLLLK